MSQVKKILKRIAVSDEYKNLVDAIEKGDCANILSSYEQVSNLIDKMEEEVKSGIEKLARRNKGEEYQKFQLAFAQRAITALPQWHWLSSELKKRNIMRGEVIDFGRKGDPLVKTAEGRVVVISGATLKKGEKIWFKVIAQGEKFDFGKVFELTPDLFYFILTQDTQEKIRNSFTSIQGLISKCLERREKIELTELSGLLRQLEDIRNLVSESKLREEDKKEVISKVLEYRRKLLKAAIPKLAFQFLSQFEENAINELCSNNKQQVSKALSSLRLLCYETHNLIKAKLISNEWLKRYQEIVEKLEKNLNSMATVIKLLELKAEIKELYPLAEEYIQKMDRFFQNLSERAVTVSLTLAEDRVYDIENIYSVIKNTFSITQVCSELRKVFNSSEEFFTLRGALSKLIRKLEGTQDIWDDGILKPYINQIVTLAFSNAAIKPTQIPTA